MAPPTNPADTTTSTEIVQRDPGRLDGVMQIEPIKDQVGGLSAVAREEAEIKAAIVIAKRYPRNEFASAAKLMRSCERPKFAEAARYAFPRGGQNVEGPSVDLAREAARCWGNFRYGLRIVSEDEERLHVKGWALDLETNNYVEAEDKFKKLIFRKNGGWQKPDERDLRELMNRRGAICVRNALLQILPPDIIDDAVGAAKDTLTKAAKGEIKQNRPDAIRRLTKAFLELGVTAAMIEANLGHGLDLVTDEEIATLRGIWKSVSDGNSRREDHFDLGAGKDKPEEISGSVDILDEVAASKEPPKPKPTTKAAPPPPPKAAEPATYRGQIKSVSVQKGNDGKNGKPKTNDRYCLIGAQDELFFTFHRSHADLAKEVMTDGGKGSGEEVVINFRTGPHGNDIKEKGDMVRASDADAEAAQGDGYEPS